MQFPQSLRRTAACCVAASVSVVSAFAGSENPNLPNFYKVDDQVYRGAQPTDAGLKDLAKLGIKTVVDLREIGEHSQAAEQKAVSDLGMHYVSVPMKGLSTPDSKLVASVLAMLTDGTSGPVFVHCKRGADRTGMVIAVYRISHDHWDNQKALAEAKSNGMSFFERSIQHYVAGYKPSTGVIEATASPDSQASTVLVRGTAQ